MNTKFEILGVNVPNPNWTGAPTELAVDDSVGMPQTPYGTMMVAYENKSTLNNEGSLAVTSGGGDPLFLDSPFGIAWPKILTNNWQANNLTITNVSANDKTPIWVEAAGPALSPKPGELKIDTAVKLDSYKAVQGVSKPNFMQLKFTSNTSNLSVIAVIGGPATGGSNGYVYALNWSGPLPGPGDGYTKVTGGNSLTMQFNWPSAVVWVCNLSPSTAAPVTVLLRSL
jgi:hypothetical protein